MRQAAAFLTALANALSTMTLYEEGHPSRDRALDKVHGHLVRLQEKDPHARFTFLGREVIYGDHPLREMRGWAWAPRMVEAGLQRLEFTGPVERDDLEVFLIRLHARIAQDEARTAQVRQTRPTNIKYGVVDLQDDGDEGDGGRRSELRTATLEFDLGDEADTVKWLHEELKRRGELHLLEALSVVRSLSVAMHGDQAYLIPLLRLKRYDQYTTTHALNVCTLSMALAEFIGLAPNEVRSFGIAGLLHDMGKVRIPDEILNKSGKLTDEERLIMSNHTVEGARILLETKDFLDLAAVVAYEHHIRIDGGGYPALQYGRDCHQASNLVHVCDVFDALRTDRPYRDAWPTDRVLNYIEEGSGKEFESDLARAFVQMMRRWSRRVAEVDAEDAPLPLDEDARGRQAVDASQASEARQEEAFGK